MEGYTTLPKNLLTTAAFPLSCSPSSSQLFIFTLQSVLLSLSLSLSRHLLLVFTNQWMRGEKYPNSCFLWWHRCFLPLRQRFRSPAHCSLLLSVQPKDQIANRKKTGTALCLASFPPATLEKYNWWLKFQIMIAECTCEWNRWLAGWPHVSEKSEKYTTLRQKIKINSGWVK